MSTWLDTLNSHLTWQVWTYECLCHQFSIHTQRMECACRTKKQCPDANFGLQKSIKENPKKKIKIYRQSNFFFVFNNWNKYSFIHLLPPHPIIVGDCGGLEPIPDDIGSRQSLPWTNHRARETNNHPQSHSHLWEIKDRHWTQFNMHVFWLWEPEYRREPSQTQGEQANSTQKGPPERTVLTTAPPCRWK